MNDSHTLISQSDVSTDCPQRPWYAIQADVGLPMTFDEWRDNYDRLTYQQQVEFYTAVYDKFPNQFVASEESVRQFVTHLPEGTTVLEVGGGLGSVAQLALQSPAVCRWYNYEVSPAAVINGLQHPKYSPVLASDFVWNLPQLPPCDTLFASHVFEHVRAAQVDQLLGKLKHVKRAYVECPIAEDAVMVDWSGGWNTHILEVGWQQLESLFTAHGFRVALRRGDVRWFHR